MSPTIVPLETLEQIVLFDLFEHFSNLSTAWCFAKHIDNININNTVSTKHEQGQLISVNKLPKAA